MGSRGRLIGVASLGKPACLARHQGLAHISCFTAAYVRLEDVLYLCSTGNVDSIKRPSNEREGGCLFWLLILQKRALNPVVISVKVVVDYPFVASEVAGICCTVMAWLVGKICALVLVSITKVPCRAALASLSTP